jgi:hypothetical protein
MCKGQKCRIQNVEQGAVSEDHKAGGSGGVSVLSFWLESWMMTHHDAVLAVVSMHLVAVSAGWHAVTAWLMQSSPDWSDSCHF